MDVHRFDPRDQTAETDDPVYRVFFWSGNSCEEWQLSHADVDEVLKWIPTVAEGRPHSLWAVTTGEDSVHHIRLRGVDIAERPIETWPPWARVTVV